MKIPVTNNTKMPMYVGASMIPPGETRHFDEQDVPHHLRPTPPDLPLSGGEKGDPLAALLQGNVKSVADALNGLSTEEVERLGELEQAGQNRKGVLSAVAELLLGRAANAELLAKVEGMSDVELADALEEAKTDINVDSDYLSALEAEAAKRNPGDVE